MAHLEKNDTWLSKRFQKTGLFLQFFLNFSKNSTQLIDSSCWIELGGSWHFI